MSCKNYASLRSTDNHLFGTLPAAMHADSKLSNEFTMFIGTGKKEWILAPQ